MGNDDTAVRRNEAKRRFELQEEGQVAGFLDYREEPGRLRLVHTEVQTGREGRGLGGRLVRHALDEARRLGLQVVPSCSFVAAWIERHPEYRDLVAD